uniref:General stress protein 17M-like domain-containing protein n=2 Tax=Gloeothece TaxID=28070 RepID=E0UKF1_GLOV7|nr:conserved hypothetical protein [Gloeothece verrucosa PCC 7822]
MALLLKFVKKYMVTQQLQQIVGRFPSRENAEAALNQLKEKGFNVDQITILAKNDEAAKKLTSTVSHEPQKQGDLGGAIAGAITGVGTGFFTGGLLGALSIKIFSEQTPVDNVGAIFIHALAGAVIGMAGCALSGALIGAALSKKPAISENLPEDKDDNYLLVLEGSEDNIRQAQGILSK